MKKFVKTFQAKSREEEMEILHNDDRHFSNIKKYLAPLIYDMCERYAVQKNLRPYIFEASIIDLEIAAKSFLKHKRDTNTTYKFCTYYTHWVRLRLKKVGDALRIKIL